MTKKTALYLLAVAFAKLAYLFFLGDGTGREGGDSFTYLEPVDNLLRLGLYTYAPDYLPGYAARMPGYAVVYLPLRAIFPREIALSGCVLIQTLLDVVGTVALASLAFRITQSRLAFGLTLVSYSLATHVSSWNDRLLTESLSASAAIFGAALLGRGLVSHRTTDLIFSGVCLAWLVFLKPVSLVPFAVAILGLLCTRETGLSLRRVALLVAPFFLVETAWITRNAIVIGSFVPAQYDVNAGYAYRRSFLSLVALVQDMGGDYVSWNPRAEIRWFDDLAGQTRATVPDYSHPSIPFPPLFVASGISEQALLDTRKLLLLAVDPSRSEVEREAADRAAELRIQEHRRIFARTRPLDRWFFAPLRIAKAYLFQSGTTNLFPQDFNSLNGARKIFKLFQAGLFSVTMAVGLPAALLGILAFLIRPSSAPSPAAILPALFVAFFSLAYPLLMRRAEYRYLVPAYPFATLFCCCTLGARFSAKERSTLE